MCNRNTIFNILNQHGCFASPGPQAAPFANLVAICNWVASKPSPKLPAGFELSRRRSPGPSPAPAPKCGPPWAVCSSRATSQGPERITSQAAVCVRYSCVSENMCFLGGVAAFHSAPIQSGQDAIAPRLIPKPPHPQASLELKRTHQWVPFNQHTLFQPRIPFLPHQRVVFLVQLPQG